MNTAIVERLVELSCRAEQWRRLASGALPSTVSEEISAVADELDDEIDRIKAEQIASVFGGLSLFGVIVKNITSCAPAANQPQSPDPLNRTSACQPLYPF